METLFLICFLNFIGISSLKPGAQAPTPSQPSLVSSETPANLNPKNIATHESHKTELRRQMAEPHVIDSDLKKVIHNNYRPNAKVGSGSSADAVRYEIQTGLPVKGKMHAQNLRNTKSYLEKWIEQNPNARPGDRAAAENVLKDIKDALGE